MNYEQRLIKKVELELYKKENKLNKPKVLNIRKYNIFNTDRSKLTIYRWNKKKNGINNDLIEIEKKQKLDVNYFKDKITYRNFLINNLSKETLKNNPNLKQERSKLLQIKKYRKKAIEMLTDGQQFKKFEIIPKKKIESIS